MQCHDAIKDASSIVIEIEDAEWNCTEEMLLRFAIELETVEAFVTSVVVDRSVVIHVDAIATITLISISIYNGVEVNDVLQ